MNPTAKARHRLSLVTIDAPAHHVPSIGPEKGLSTHGPQEANGQSLRATKIVDEMALLFGNIELPVRRHAPADAQKMASVAAEIDGGDRAVMTDPRERRGLRHRPRRRLRPRARGRFSGCPPRPRGRQRRGLRRGLRRQTKGGARGPKDPNVSSPRASSIASPVGTSCRRGELRCQTPLALPLREMRPETMRGRRGALSMTSR